MGQLKFAELVRPSTTSNKYVVNKDTDKEAHVPASVFIIADC